MNILHKVRNLFFEEKKKGGADNQAEQVPFRFDMHSHLLPGIDDGAKDMNDAIRLCLQLEEMGYKKLVTTPHCMGDFYKNNPDTILPLRDQLREALLKEGSELTIEASAEYYLDEWFPEKIKNKELLPFEGNYILIETPFQNKPEGFRKMVFELQTKGYKPVLAHPERYAYVRSTEEYEEWAEMGIHLQVNITSLAGMYSKRVRENAKKLIEKKLVHFAGTDVHNQKHINLIKDAMKQNAFQRLTALNLINK